MSPHGARKALAGTGAAALLMAAACERAPVQHEPAPPSRSPGTHQEVPLWEMLEVEVTNARRYANPFVDTELRATFTTPSGEEVDFFGFHDGDGAGGQSGTVWKLRFMCTEAGRWSWTAAFSDGAPGAAGTFDCLVSGAPGPLRADAANPRWLRRADGEPFLPRWYYLHELLFTPEGQWQQDVEAFLVRPGYNLVTVLTTQAEGLLENGWNSRAYARPLFYPWPREGPEVRWDRFDLRSWRHLDTVLDHLAERGIYVHFFDGFFPNLAPRFPEDRRLEERYLRYALARLGPRWNVTHNLAFEFSEFMTTGRLNRLGAYLHSIDPFGTLTTAHDTQAFDALVTGQAWLDAANLQFDAGRVPSAAVANAFVDEHYAGKPVLATELVWEGPQKLDANQVRRGAWGITMAGGAFLYGEFDIGQEGLGPYGAGDAHAYLRILHDFLEGLPFTSLAPYDELVSAGALALADPGRVYVVYLESGGMVSVDLSGVTGALAAQWMDPRTGARTAVPGGASGGGVRSFTSPGAGDWVLYLSR